LKLNEITVAEKLNDMLGRTGEKIQIAHYEFLEAPFVSSYNHHGNRLATILGLNKKDAKNTAEIAHELAMQVAAMNPIAIDKEDVSQEAIDREIEIGRNRPGRKENLKRCWRRLQPESLRNSSKTIHC